MDGPREEELLTGPGLPRWLPWTGGGLLAAVLVAVLALNLGDGGTPAASPTPSTTSAGSATAGPATLAAPPDPVDGTTVHLPFADVPTDVVAAGDRTFAIAGNNLVRIDGRSFSAGIVEDLTPDLASSSALELDAPAHLVWVVPIGEPRPTVRAFDTDTLTPIGKVHPAHAIDTAAALNGHLYVPDGRRLLRFSRNGAIANVGSGVSHVFSLAADPTRRRLLATVDSGATRIMLAAFSESGRMQVVRPPIDLVKGALSVAGSGQIWLAGYGFNGAILVRLDQTLQHTQAVSSLANQLGPGAVVLASGADSLLVQSAGGQSELWCTSASTGAVEQSWPLESVRAASVHGRAFVVSTSDLVQLDLTGRCTG